MKTVVFKTTMAAAALAAGVGAFLTMSAGRTLSEREKAVRGFTVKSCVAVLGVFLVMSSVLAKDETLDVQAFLPLLERNSLGRKILDVSYSMNYEISRSDKETISGSGQKDVRLVFDAETGKYREEIKDYGDPNDVSAYGFYVNMWDGKEFVTWLRLASKRPGSRALSSGVYEYPGHAAIYDQPFVQIPSFASFFYDQSSCSFVKTVPEHNPKLGCLAGDMIIIETELHRFEFLKKTGALKRIDYYSSKGIIYRTHDFSNHVACSGIWIPLRIVETLQELDGRVWYKNEISVDPKTLRLLDNVKDPAIFNEPLPAGCAVNDQIRKKIYTVTTADTLPNDVEALTKALEKMVEQALEQKEAAEKEMREKRKKK